MTKHEAPPPYNTAQMTQMGANHGAPAQPNVTHVTVAQPQFGGTCPVCHAGKFESGFTLCGWLCCIFCFPCGIICCFCMRKKKCNHCGFAPS